VKPTPLLLALGLLLCGAAAPDARAAGGLYLGAGIGQGSVRDDTATGNFDADHLAYKAFAGYRFDKIPIVDLALEGGYTDFGKPSQDVGAQRVEFKLHGAYAAGLLIFPLGPFDLYGKAGAISAKLESSSAGSTSSRTGTDAFYGLGAAFYVWKLGFRAEYERYNIKDVDRVQLFSVSALFQF
jgi:outer membrane immunogenic protein